MGILQNIGYILIGFIALVSIFLIVLTLLERRLHMRFLKDRYGRNQMYLEKISHLDINAPQKSIVEFDNLLKAFFREAFHIKGNPEYSELEEFFKKRNNKKAIEICNNMSKLLYSGKPASKEELQKLIYISAEIISSNKIISKEEKKELDKKSMKNQPSKITSSFKKIIKRDKTSKAD